ncbi:MAG: low temperature requirement protein A [Streptosporangiaceae bacterium]
MTARRSDEEHRAATPLELFFDLCFVVAVAQAGTALHHALGEGHFAHGVGSYLMVFFAIWWAWMNFTWFASAYDSDDVLYRVAVLVQITGALVIAAGVERAFEHNDYTVIVIGYTIMRVAMISQWVRAAVSHPAGRPTALRYAAGLFVAQAFWVSILAVPKGAVVPYWFLCVLIDLAVPVLAERTGMTAWHPEHIAERYGLFTIIVLGESVAAATIALKAAFDAHLSASLIGVAAGGILIMYALWWLYFVESAGRFLNSVRAAFTWGYGHYVIFAAGAGVGAGLAVAAAHAGRTAHISRLAASAAVTIPVAVFLLAIWALHLRHGRTVWPVPITAALILALTYTGPAVLLTGLALAALVAIVEYNVERDLEGNKALRGGA